MRSKVLAASWAALSLFLRPKSDEKKTSVKDE
jgi:hypothetical protein